MARIRPERVRWGWPDAVILGSVAIVVCYGFPNLLWPAGIPSAASYFVQTTVVSMWLLVPTVMWLKSARKVRLAEHWLPVDNLLRDAVVGVELAMILAVTNGIGIKLLLERPFGKPGSDVFRVTSGTQHWSEVALLVVGVAVLVPLGEEVFFRGMLYPAMRRYLRTFPSVIFNAAIFAAAHRDERMKTAFLLGLIAAIMMEYTGSLVVPVLVHMGTNFAFVVFLARGGHLAEAMPVWLLALIFAVMNVHLFLGGKLLFGQPSAEPRRLPGASRQTQTGHGDAPQA